MPSKNFADPQTFGIDVTAAPAAAVSSIGIVSPTSVPYGGTLTLSGITIDASPSTWWRLELAVKDADGQTVGTFPAIELQGPQEIQVTSSPLQGSGLNPGGGLTIVGTLTEASDYGMTQDVSSTDVSTGTVATVTASGSGGGGSGGTTQSPECQSLWDQYNSLYQQQYQLRLQAADLYPSGNLPASLAQQIQDLANQMDAIEIQYGQNGCTVTLPG